MSNDAKKLILARRARFIAAALAGLSTNACGKTEAKLDGGTEMAPQPCLEPPPAPCLTVMPPQPDPPDAADVSEPSPQPCLSTVAQPPMACLSVARPRQSDGGVPDCRVPYTVDAQGRKHFKIECL